MVSPPPICNINITNSRYPWILAVGLAAVICAAPLSVRATALQFTLDTSSLSGTPASLAFDFIDGDGVANNTVTISDFSTDGTLGAASTIGDVTGTLPPGPVTLADTAFFNEFLQELTLRSTVSFTLTLTQKFDASGGLADSFAFFLLDATAIFPLFDTTDLTGAGALFAVDIDGSSSGALYDFAPVSTSVAVNWTVEPVASVPLPSTALLIGAGLLAGMTARRRVAFGSMLDRSVTGVS